MPAFAFYKYLSVLPQALGKEGNAIRTLRKITNTDPCPAHSIAATVLPSSGVTQGLL